MDHNKFYSELRKDLKLVLKRYKTNIEYKGGFAYAIHVNNLLKEGNKLSSIWENEIRLLDELTNLYKIDEPLDLFRVCNYKELQQFISDGILRYPAFLSTSTSYKSTLDFLQNGDQNASLNITIPNQTYIALMDGMEGETGEENEILLPRNLSFKIEKEEVIKDPKKLKDKLGMKSLGVTQITELRLKKISTVA